MDLHSHQERRKINRLKIRREEVSWSNDGKGKRRRYEQKNKIKGKI